VCPLSNGCHLISGSEDKTLRVWEIDTGLFERRSSTAPNSLTPSDLPLRSVLVAPSLVELCQKIGEDIVLPPPPMPPTGLTRALGEGELREEIIESGQVSSNHRDLPTSNPLPSEGKSWCSSSHSLVLAVIVSVTFYAIARYRTR
jgi:hypothetical protein